MLGRKPPVFAKRSFQALPDFGCFPRLQADLFRTLTRSEHAGLEVEAVARQGTKSIGRFEVDEVLRSLSGNQFRLGRRTPAIRFGTEVFNLIECCLRAKERRRIRGQIASRQTIDNSMTFVTPGTCGLRPENDSLQGQ